MVPVRLSPNFLTLKFPVYVLKIELCVPYWTVGSIRVFGMYSPNHSASSCIFLDFMDITWGQEHGRLISIFYCNLDRHSVLERSIADELRINMYIGGLYLQAICSFGFKIYRLVRMKRRLRTSSWKDKDLIGSLSEANSFSKRGKIYAN